jgi:hypothetical protein
MDEYLFISMAKLGADRVKAERVRRGESVTASIPGKRPSTPVPPSSVVPSELASRLATFSLLFAGALAALGIGGGLAAALERVPAGEVTVTEVGANADLPADEVKVAQAE